MPAELPLLVDPTWLARELPSADLRVIDASWYLPDAGRDATAEYAQGHVPGAVHLDLSTDLADGAAPVRNTIAAPARLAEVFGAAGIGSDHRVVVYDRLGGFSAGRVWWALRYAGHSRAALLDGGFARWQTEGHPVTADASRWTPASFTPAPRPHTLVSRADVLRVVHEGGARIVDARSAVRFRGEGVEHTKHAGHIPGAANVAYGSNLIGDPPVFRSPAELREIYAAAGVRMDGPVITTCGSGVTAALNAFALALAGYERVAVYDGSWAEWGDADDVPIESGS